MAINYTALRDNVAFKLLNDNGQSVTWTKVTGYTDDPDAGTRTPTTSTVTAKGVVTEFDSRDVDGTLIQREDKKLVMDAKSFNDASVVPSDDDSVTIGGVKHEVVRLMPSSPAGTAIVYKAQVRAT